MLLKELDCSSWHNAAMHYSSVTHMTSIGAAIGLIYDSKLH